jgi:hypothetical protein
MRVVHYSASSFTDSWTSISFEYLLYCGLHVWANSSYYDMYKRKAKDTGSEEDAWCKQVWNQHKGRHVLQPGDLSADWNCVTCLACLAQR